MTTQINETLNDYAREAIIGAMADHDIKLLSVDPKDCIGEWGKEIYACILGFSSPEMNGSLLICCESDFLEMMVPNVGVGEEDLRYQDWLGEMANLTVGRLKTSMIAHGVSISLNPPSVSMSPVTILENYAERNPSGPFWFELNDLKFCVQLGADVDASVDFNKKIEVPNLHPGGAVFNMNPVKAKKKLQPASEVPIGNVENEKKPLAPAPGSISFEVLDGKARVLFSGGVIFSVNLDQLSGEQAISILGHNIEVLPQSGGCYFKVDGLGFFFPQEMVA